MKSRELLLLNPNLSDEEVLHLYAAECKSEIRLIDQVLQHLRTSIQERGIEGALELARWMEPISGVSGHFFAIFMGQAIGELLLAREMEKALAVRFTVEGR